MGEIVTIGDPTGASARSENRFPIELVGF
jgi:hypothetical protein